MSSPVMCTLCKRRAPHAYDSLEHLEAHIAQHHFQCLTYFCEQCPQFGSGFFPTEASIVQHMRVIHGVEGEYEFKTILQEDTIEKRVKIRQALDQCIHAAGNVNIERDCVTATVPLAVEPSSINKHYIHAASTTESVATVTTITSSAIAPNGNNKQYTQTAGTTETEIVAAVTAITSPAIAPNGNNNQYTHAAGTTETESVAAVTAITSSAIGPPSNNNKRSTSVAPEIAESPLNNKNVNRNKRSSETPLDTTGWKIPKKSQQQKRSGGSKDKSRSESASKSKGGYNDVKIDKLFEDMDQRNNNKHDSANEEESGVRSNLDPPQQRTKGILQLQQQEVCKGLQQQDFVLPWLGRLSSSTLDMTLCKSEALNREHRSKLIRGNSVAVSKVVDLKQSVDKMLKRPQEKLVAQRTELVQDFDRQIREDLLNRVRKRDRQLKERQQQQNQGDNNGGTERQQKQQGDNNDGKERQKKQRDNNGGKERSQKQGEGDTKGREEATHC